MEPIGWSHYGSNTTKQHMHNGQRRSEPKRLRARRTTEPDGSANSDALGRLHANTSGINNVEICWMALGADSQNRLRLTWRRRGRAIAEAFEKGFATCYAARSGSWSPLVLLSGATICRSSFRSSLETLSATFSGQSRTSEYDSLNCSPQS